MKASDLIEIGGFAALVDAIYRLAGTGFAVLAAALILLFIGAIVDDAAVADSVRGLARAPFRIYSNWARSATPHQRRRSPSDLPPSERPISTLGD